MVNRPSDIVPARSIRRGSELVPRIRGIRVPFSLAVRFMLTSLAILIVGGLVIGVWVGRQLERGVLTRTASIAALYVESFVEPHLQPLTTRPVKTLPRLAESDVAALDRLVSDTSLGERVVVFRVWSPDGVVLYSPNPEFINRQFPLSDELARAVRGEVVADLSDLSASENEAERARWSRLLEVYVPVRERGTGRVIAVTEFYQLPDELEAAVAASRLRSWALVAGTMLVAYLALAGIVKRGSDTIGRQQAALKEQVVELSRLLEQNGRLHRRIRQAAARTTALNEQALRRISADLHDGPGQALALALLRLDALEERRATAAPEEAPDFAVVHGAVRDALAEIRSISAGLRLPRLAEYSVAEAAQRAVREHERRSGIPIRLTVEEVPEPVSLSVKIALVRSLQEALSNATRHGGGVDVSARVWSEGGMLCLSVDDRGPGFTPDDAPDDGHLGLAGMRERAELLGGSFAVESASGRGATVRLRWPLSAVSEP